MLGNDIIDLRKAKAESNWKRDGYLAKVFSTEEQLQIRGSNHPDQLVWLFWSMKEATYKIIQREGLKRRFHPKDFNCESGETQGIVRVNGRTYFTMSVINEDMVHTLSSTATKNLIHSTTYYAENNKAYLSEFNAKFTNYSLEKDVNGIPNLIDSVTGQRYVASISHHGKYLAIVFATHLLL